MEEMFICEGCDKPVTATNDEEYNQAHRHCNNIDCKVECINCVAEWSED